MMAKEYWEFFTKVNGTLTPKVIDVMFKHSATDFEGLSEMKICSCVPEKCVFHNGVRGPLVDEGDVYETDPDMYPDLMGETDARFSKGDPATGNAVLENEDL